MAKTYERLFVLKRYMFLKDHCCPRTQSRKFPQNKTVEKKTFSELQERKLTKLSPRQDPFKKKTHFEVILKQFY